MTRPLRHKRHWTPEEDQALLFMLDAGMGPRSAARKLGRSSNAVNERLIVHHKISPKRVLVASEGMGVAQLSDELGANREYITECIRRGWLKATARIIARQKVYTIAPDDVRAFIAQRGGYAPLNPNDDWQPLVEQARAAFQARYISRKATARLLHVCPKVVRRWQLQCNFPPPVLRLHQTYGGDFFDRASVRAWLRCNPQHQTSGAKATL